MASRIILLKTKSEPTDAYHDSFSTVPFPTSCDRDVPNRIRPPVFIPVMNHRVVDHAKTWFEGIASEMEFPTFTSPTSQILSNNLDNPGYDGPYGGIIITSQRAVEALSSVLESIKLTNPNYTLGRILPPKLPIYAVGPATSQSVRQLSNTLGAGWTVVDRHPANQDVVVGSGAELADVIVDDFPLRFQHYNTIPRLLFLTGDKRRDVIPEKLASSSINLDELVMYETVEQDNLASSLRQILLTSPNQDEQTDWIVVFSPTGCAVLANVLQNAAVSPVDPTNTTAPIVCPLVTTDGRPTGSHRRFYIVAIGPTTRQFLVNKVGLQPHAMADRPSVDGVRDAICRFEAGLYSSRPKTSG